MDADTKIHDESEYNELVKITEKIHAKIEKWAAENGVNLSPKFIEKKRNQHYVPRCYLELWRDSEKMLYQSIKGGEPIPVRGNSKKVAQSKDFYRVQPITEEDRDFLLGLVKAVKSPDISNFLIDFIKIYEITGGLMQIVSDYTWPQTSGDAETPDKIVDTLANNLIEELYAEIEATAAYILRKIALGRTNWWKAERSKVNFLLFFGTQYFRTPGILKKATQLTSPTNVGLSEYVIYPLMMIMSMQIVDDMVTKPDDYYITLLINDSDVPFITGIQPIVDARPNKQGAYNLYYPITARYAILLKKKERRRKGIIKVTIDGNEAHMYNNLVKNSSDILIASDAKILKKYANQGN
jgi:hypothetical protein